MTSTTPSFTRAARQERDQDLYNACNNNNFPLRTALGSGTALSMKDNKLDRSSNNVANSNNVAKSWDVAKSWNANSHFHRRSQVEARLVELRKDVVSLVLKLRFSGNSRPLLDVSSVLSTSKTREEKKLESLKVNQKPSTIKSRRKSVKEQLCEAKKGGDNAVKTLKELYDVTIERDQLKLELVRTKKALAAARKKSEDVEKNQKAYDELTVHCASLQKSLDLSEKIQVKQKNMLQQLQSQQRQRTAKEESENSRNRVTGVKMRTKSAGVSTSCRSTNTGLQQAQDDSSARGHTRIYCGHSNSLVASGQPKEEEHHNDKDTEQAASEPTAAADTRPKVPRPVLELTTSKGEQSQDAESQHPGQIAGGTTRPPSRAQARQLETMRQAAMWARSRGAMVQIPTVNTHMTPKRRAADVVRPKNGYLAPTQASLRRLHDLPRRETHYRPPFIV